MWVAKRLTKCKGKEDTLELFFADELMSVLKAAESDYSQGLIQSGAIRWYVTRQPLHRIS